MALVETLTEIGLATGAARSSVVYALVSATHVFGIGLLLAPVILMDLALIGVLRGFNAQAIDTLRRTVIVGLAMAASSGVLLLSTKPAEYLANGVFISKMAVIVIALANAAALEWRARGTRPPAVPSYLQRWQAAASIVAWLAVLLLGRWIAFT